MASEEVEQLYSELTDILPFYVGRNDGTGKVFRFSTLAEAEAKIADFETVCPADVHNGEFYIDGPEELVQEQGSTK
jgi:hypothetical protein